MENKLNVRFSEIYSPLVSQFISKVREGNIKNLPEPFLPVYGTRYSKSDTKIMFMGWETRNAHSLEEFVKSADANIADVLQWFNDEFEEFEFIHWRSNLGRDFWTFNLKFIASFYGISDWKELYRNPEKYEDILSSFSWANCDSIERYEVTAQKNGVNYSDWQKVKEASHIFDNPELIFSTLTPDIVMLLHWHKEEDWLLKGIQVTTESEPYPYLWHYKCLLEGRELQIFWTGHPRGLPKDIDFETLVKEIISIYTSNKS